MTIGQQIRIRRLELNMTQKQLGKELGIHRQLISQIERGASNASTKRLGKFAAYMRFIIIIPRVLLPAGLITEKASPETK